MKLMPQVANFEYVDEGELAAEEETPVPPAENRASVNNSERASYWEELLRDKYEVHKIEEFNAMGKGKRSRKQVCFVVYWIDQFVKFENNKNNEEHDSRSIYKFNVVRLNESHIHGCK